MSELKTVSYWFDTLNEDLSSRAPLEEHAEVDVAIIGAGFTGLWTAYYLKQQQPDLSIAIVEARTAGFGASGRNAGWLIGGIAGETNYLAALPTHQRDQGYQLLFGIIDEVASVLKQENIDCDLHRGGAIYAAARYHEQLGFMQNYLHHLHAQGLTDDDYRWLSAQELDQQIRMRNGYGGIYTPHCATINPAKLVRGLARCVEHKGVTIYEQSPALTVDGKSIYTQQGSLKANTIIPATEGFSGSLLNLKKYLLPVQSLIIATEPLNQSQWDEIGLEQRPAFGDGGRLTTYAQRTMDGRLIFGARGGYQFGGKVRHQFALSDPEFRMRERLMRDLFPSLQNVAITHGWGGTLGMARSFRPFAVYDPNSGIAGAGGYGGEGVGASNLFGRTLADLILGRQSELTQMPWAFSPASYKSALGRWEPEPFRWLTYKAILNCFSWEDNLYNREQAPRWQKKTAAQICSTLELLIK